MSHSSLCRSRNCRILDCVVLGCVVLACVVLDCVVLDPVGVPEKVMRRCWLTIRSSHASLEQLQQLMGSINDLAQMSPLLKFHKRSGNALLRKFNGNNNIVLMMMDELRRDLVLITKVVNSSIKGLPIASSPKHPMLAAELGALSWIRVPAFSCSWRFRHAGPRERNFF